MGGMVEREIALDPAGSHPSPHSQLAGLGGTWPGLSHLLKVLIWDVQAILRNASFKPTGWQDPHCSHLQILAVRTPRGGAQEETHIPLFSAALFLHVISALIKQFANSECLILFRLSQLS